MARAVYPGTFDPMTRGHLDVVQRVSAIFDETILAVGNNPSKQPLFTLDDRVAMAREETQHLPDVRVDAFQGLVIDYVRSVAPAVILRGLRNLSDFDAECQMALTNRMAGHGVETLFVMSSPEYACHTARLIKEIASCGGDVAPFVTDGVRRRLEAHFAGGGSP